MWTWGRRFFASPGLLGVLVLLALMTARSRSAQAYPQWQLSSGAGRCSQCHYAPGGGGLMNSYGRDAAGEELSMIPGDGAFLHGAYTPPSWLAIGGDLRGALVNHDVQDPEGPRTAAFPMQADLSIRLALGPGLSVYGTGGLRGQVRQPETDLPSSSYEPATASRLISREHWVMWQPELLGPYVRLGRFYAPYGLRMAEHLLYVRRDLGFDMLRESYNVSGGFIQESSELHVTLFAPDVLRHIGSEEKGVALYYEHRGFSDTVALAGQGRVADGPGATRYMLGAVGKVYVDRLKTLFLSEVDLVQMVFDDPNVSARSQLVAAAGATVFPARGLMTTLLAERNQVDLTVRDAGWTAATVLLSWFPYAHAEVQLMARLQFPSGGDTARTLLAQIHYFL